MPLPFDFEGKGVLLVSDAYSPSSSSSSSSSSSVIPFSNPFLHKWSDKEGSNWFFRSEPTSVLDSIGSPTSTSTLSSSLGGGGGGSGGGSTGTAAVAAVSGNPSHKWPPPPAQQQETSRGEQAPPPLLIGSSAAAGVAEKCGLGTEDWESQEQEQSILRWIMGDADDPSIGLNKLLQSGGGGPATTAEFEFSGGFNVGDQGFGLDPAGENTIGSFVNPSIPNSGFSHNPRNPCLSLLPNNLSSISLSPNAFNPPDLKPQIFDSQMLINSHQAQITQNPAFFLPLPYAHQEQQHLILPPPPKRHHPSVSKGSDSSMLHKQPGLQFDPRFLNQRPKMAGDEMGQQGVIDQLYKAAELVSNGNSQLAQGILARLNDHLSPIGKPFHRAAFLCKEALQLLLQTNNPLHNSSPFNLILKIGAYKSFSEISPIIQFSNFTCNQALLEALEGFDRIHVIDFDIGYGGQWASLMHELSLRNGGAVSLRITAFASPSTHDQLELGLTAENLNHFAGEINMAFEFDIMNLDSLNSGSWSLPLHVSENEAIAVNLPVGSLSNYQLSLPIILRFVKQLSPKIVVSVDRGFDRTELPFPNHVIHTLQTYSNLIESLDAVNVNPDALQKIERFLFQPEIEKTMMGHYRVGEKVPNWRNLFLSSGFSPLTFSNFAESQAECVVKRTPVRGFHVEKRQSSLVLCWQRKELISASAWRC